MSIRINVKLRILVRIDHSYFNTIPLIIFVMPEKPKMRTSIIIYLLWLSFDISAYNIMITVKAFYDQPNYLFGQQFFG